MLHSLSRDVARNRKHLNNQNWSNKQIILLRRAASLVPLLTVIFLFPANLNAQDKVTISGTVLEAETGETLANAAVRIEGSTIGVATNLEGHFVLVNILSGYHTLNVSYIGYRETRVLIHTDSLAVPFIIELVSTAAELDEVIVSSDSYSIMKVADEVSQITISPRDLRGLPSIGDVDVFRSIQLLPGISGTNEGSSGLYVRGGTPDENLVLLDGMTVYHVDHFFGFFSAFNADAIKDVQVYKGGFPAKFGGRTSSVIDMAGKTGDVNQFRGGFGLNMLSTNAVIEIPIGGRGSFLFSGRRSYTDILQTGLYNDIYETLTGDDITPDEEAGAGGQGPGGGGALRGGARGPNSFFVQPDFFFYDVNAKLTYRPTDRDALAFSIYNSQDHLDKSRDQNFTFGPGGGEANQASLTNNLLDLTEWGNLGGSALWSRQWHPQFFTKSLVSYTQYFSDYDRNAFIERRDAETDTVTFSANLGAIENNRVNDFTLRIDNEWQFSQPASLEFGVQLTQSEISYSSTRDDTLQVLDRNDTGFNGAIYAQTHWNPNPVLAISGGLRTVYYDQTEKLYFEPRLSAKARLTTRISINGAFGIYNQFVARVVNENVTEGARDFWLLADGDQVGVSHSTHYILGLSYETPQYLFSVESYYRDTADLTEFSLRFQRNPSTGRGPGGALGSGATAIVTDELFYTGDGVAKGLEFLVQKKFGLHTGWISYTLASVEHTFPELNNGEPFPALHDQRHELKLVYSLNFRKWSFSTTWLYASGKPYTSPESQYFLTLLDGTEQSFIHVGGKNEERLPAYHRLDAAVHYKFRVKQSRMDIGFSVFNLYNRENVWYKEFDLSETPMVTTDFTFLGVTPNLSIRVDI